MSAPASYAYANYILVPKCSTELERPRLTDYIALRQYRGTGGGWETITSYSGLIYVNFKMRRSQARHREV